MRECLLKKLKLGTRKDELQMRNQQNNLIEVVEKKISDAIQDLIRLENPYVGQTLRMLNTNGLEAVDMSQRREINVCFMQCLINVEESHSKALVWLKRHVDFEICKIIIDDWNHTGTKFQVIKDKLLVKKETVETNTSEKIKENYNR